MSKATAPPSGTIKSQPRGNARATVRYRCAPATLGRVALPEDHELQHAWVLNLSLTGAGLTVPRPVPAGIDATIHIRSTDGRTHYELPARIAHCTEQPQGDWSLGCEFLKPLSPDDLDHLL